MSFEHKCRACSGYGRWDTGAICFVCKGRGVIHINADEKEFQQCRPCNGHGHWDNLSVCPVCNGLGIVKKIYAE